MEKLDKNKSAHSLAFKVGRFRKFSAGFGGGAIVPFAPPPASYGPVEKKLHLTFTFRPIIFKTSTLNLIDVKMILLNCAITALQRFSEGKKLVLSLSIIIIECHLTVG